MPELSPQAQEVFWAFNRAASGKPDDWHYLPAIAAALQVAADEVIPSGALRIGDYDEYAQGFLAAQLKYRGKFLEIIAELEAQ